MSNENDFKAGQRVTATGVVKDHVDANVSVELNPSGDRLLLAAEDLRPADAPAKVDPRVVEALKLGAECAAYSHRLKALEALALVEAAEPSKKGRCCEMVDELRAERDALKEEVSGLHALIREHTDEKLRFKRERDEAREEAKGMLIGIEFIGKELTEARAALRDVAKAARVVVEAFPWGATHPGVGKLKSLVDPLLTDAPSEPAKEEPKPARPFRVGDAVKVVNAEMANRGRSGIVTKVGPREPGTHVAFGDGALGNYGTEDLELVTPAPTETAKCEYEGFGCRAETPMDAPCAGCATPAEPTFTLSEIEAAIRKGGLSRWWLLMKGDLLAARAAGGGK